MKLYTVVTKNFEDISKLKTTNALNACVCAKRIFKLSDTAWIIIIGMHQNRYVTRHMTVTNQIVRRVTYSWKNVKLVSSG